jgi:uncharacterized protein with von Willebrand factor type A (vWA) domain
VARAERARRSRRGIRIFCGVEVGGKIERALRREIALLCDPETEAEALCRIVEHRLLQFQTRDEDQAGRGPMVVLLDASGSMMGKPMEWARALAACLARIASKERRKIFVRVFNHYVCGRFDGRTDADVLPMVKNLLSIYASGGTDFEDPMNEARIAIEGSEGKYADVVLLTDGEARWPTEAVKKIHDAGARVFCLLIGTSASEGMRRDADLIANVRVENGAEAAREILRVLQEPPTKRDFKTLVEA